MFIIALAEDCSVYIRDVESFSMVSIIDLEFRNVYGFYTIPYRRLVVITETNQVNKYRCQRLRFNLLAHKHLTGAFICFLAKVSKHS